MGQPPIDGADLFLLEHAASMFSLFGKKKPPPAPTVIHPAVSAQLVPVDAFPQATGDVPSVSIDRPRRVRIEGQLPQARLVESSEAEMWQAGFVVQRSNRGESLALLNRPGGEPFEQWSLTPDGQPADRQTLPPPPEDQWAGLSVCGVAPLIEDQLLLAVRYNNPRPRHSLLVYAPSAGTFHHLAVVEPDTRELHRLFEVQHLSESACLVLGFSQRRRASSEIYHNYLHHVWLFSPQHPQGWEFLSVGIDQGNIVEWKVYESTLWIRTLDDRDPAKPRHSCWSLDLTRILS